MARPLHPFVFKLGRIGDMVMLTAALRLLHARYGKPCYVVGADAWAPDIYLGLPEVAECWSVPRKAPTFFGFAWPAIVRALRASAPGPVYVFEHHPGQVRRIRRLLRLSGIDPQTVHLHRRGARIGVTLARLHSCVSRGKRRPRWTLRSIPTRCSPPPGCRGLQSWRASGPSATAGFARAASEASH